MIITCKVNSVRPLASNTYRILLQPESPVDFHAGQYLLVVMAEGDKRPFSIASSPCRQGGELELHIGAAEHNAYAGEVVDAMNTALQHDGEITIDAPHGNAWLKEDTARPLLLIAGGTGFSYVRSILDHCLNQNIQRDIFLYWGAKDVLQLYAFNELRDLAAQHARLTFTPVVEISTDPLWDGKVGNVLQAVCADFESLEEFDIYIAGRFDMAGAAREQFTQNKHARSERIYGDAFAFI
ncbi:NAD(P)H-flavin reductase [Vibrio gazogenes]|uniref:Aquacobalamin reductase / NAD(P)H-flavin reductase n=1 Tax=Vibrio gazogenes DSM 21264 = NBRC 103151 TaxID=1123492 RepID=A0A1M5FVJ2_VIBGA|nr:NAD(P)H-flavin reductase [Vibrio gazogenes]USP13520.1 NAD(P)H-flavin reductase [Vibrio gazogenes]SHF95221.1 aquacobalamin reductase / NAD(P)H-flavin reductase [Vibrio gazogenes DSM 21264] [Vibrio gazogenes DSM 21264 = NBRC 103151]SJN59209.1 NAD(P)H-flavin reductase [Vibrio gazogenes]